MCNGMLCSKACGRLAAGHPSINPNPILLKQASPPTLAAGPVAVVP